MVLKWKVNNLMDSKTDASIANMLSHLSVKTKFNTFYALTINEYRIPHNYYPLLLTQFHLLYIGNKFKCKHAKLKTDETKEKTD